MGTANAGDFAFLIRRPRRPGDLNLDKPRRLTPADAWLKITATLPNGDVGFVHKDQAAVVKVVSFPFTDYGTIHAQVVRVADDTIA